MTVVADLDEPAPVEAQTQDEPEEDDGGALPLRGMTALATSAAFAVWTSLTCFVC